MLAIKDFAYQDRNTGRPVQVKAGREVDPLVLASHQCDVAKLIRTRFVVAQEAPSEVSPGAISRALAEVPAKRRGRPRKQSQP